MNYYLTLTSQMTLYCLIKVQQATEHFQTIESSAKEVGLNINYDKTKIMLRNVADPRAEVTEGVAEYIALEVVNDFRHLGA